MNALAQNIANSKPKLFYLVAGEASGDILGARLMESLKVYFPTACFRGIGGQLMQQAGLESFYPMERLSVMGIVPIIARLPELLRMRNRLAKTIVQQKTDCFIGIDAPVFNTHLEYILKKQQISTVHYVSPSVWAWRENRIYKIVKSVSLMICLFPFELDIYKKHQLAAICIGHPLADEIPMEPDIFSARKTLSLPQNKKILAILPGSRGSEMKFLLEPFFSAIIKLSIDFPELQFVLPCANQKRRLQIEDYFNNHQPIKNLTIFDGQSRTVMQASDFVLLASGTATLEAMLLKKPMVVGYKVSSFSYWIYSKFLKIKNFSLPNLLAGERLVAELIQDDCNTESIYVNLKQLIEEKSERSLASEFSKIHQSLRLNGSQKAAQAIANMVNN